MTMKLFTTKSQHVIRCSPRIIKEALKAIKDEQWGAAAGRVQAAFTWSNTPEGHNYWIKTRDQLRRGLITKEAVRKLQLYYLANAFKDGGK